MPNDVFISYRRKDSDFVSQLHRELTNRGISAWFDKESIEVGDHWRSSIAEGIRDCKVFVLVLSPDAVQSINIRKEVDLAESHQKPIVPLVWRKTDIPVMFEYALAGIQWIEFNEAASAENFDKLAGIIQRILGGEPAGVEQPTEPSPSTRPQRGSAGRRGRGTAQEVSATGTGVGVITKVVTQISSFTAAEQDAINEELKWLFTAADHFLKVRRGEAAPSAPVSVAIPPEAEPAAGANNALLPSLDDFAQQMADTQIQGIIKQINIYLRNLAIELEKQALQGGAAQSNLALINSIKLQQQSIADRTQELAGLIQQLYGILVYGPDDIKNQLAG